MTDPTQYWWPVATEAQLRKAQPIARTLLDTPLVLFLDETGKPTALHDRCPHRHAPLSRGKVVSGQIACPYHGWRFDARGACTRVPGLAPDKTRHELIPLVQVKEQGGLIWATLGEPLQNPTPARSMAPADTDSFFMTDTVACRIDEAAENFLDGFHTHFVHAGWIRRDHQRQTVTAKVKRITQGIEACYSSEGLQSGLISRLLEGSRTVSYGRFILPGIAEIEYQGRQGLNLLITAWLTPESSHRVRVHARITTRKGLTPAWLKRVVLNRLFRVILSQDKAILEATTENKRRFLRNAAQDSPAIMDTPLDLLGPSIRALLTGNTLDASVERTMISQM